MSFRTLETPFCANICCQRLPKSCSFIFLDVERADYTDDEAKS